MNRDLGEAIKVYATKPHKELSSFLVGKSKDQLIALFVDLLTAYINDRNSSTLREFLVVSLAGYKHHDAKIGYNGFKQSTAIGGKTIACEAKPQNINTEDNKNRKTKRKLNGGGNFTDYSNKRLAKDLKENPNMLIAGFVNGELMYILEAPFKTPSFVKKLKKQIKRRFPHGDKSGEFLRSANFDFRDFKDSKTLRVAYLNKERIKDNRKEFVKVFFDFLMNLK